MSQEKLQTMVMQKFWGGNRGVVWDCASSKWKATESVRIYLLKNLYKDIMVFELRTQQKLQFTFRRWSQSSRLCLEISLMEVKT